MAGGATAQAAQAAYAAYLERAERLLGPLSVGGYRKHRGRLVKKLSPEEFSARFCTYDQVREVYEQALARGDTVNDAMQKLLEEHAAELLLLDA